MYIRIGIGLCYWLALFIGTLLSEDRLGETRTILAAALELCGLVGAGVFGRFYSVRIFAEAEELAMRDHLTGLPNRAYFMDKLAAALARSPRTQKSVAVLYIDLDHFKRVNDSLGHSGGDRVLSEVGKRPR